MSGDGDWGIVNLAPKPDWLAIFPDWIWSYDFPNNVINAGVSFLPIILFITVEDIKPLFSFLSSSNLITYAAHIKATATHNPKVWIGSGM